MLIRHKVWHSARSDPLPAWARCVNSVAVPYFIFPLVSFFQLFPYLFWSLLSFQHLWPFFFFLLDPFGAYKPRHCSISILSCLLLWSCYLLWGPLFLREAKGNGWKHGCLTKICCYEWNSISPVMLRIVCTRSHFIIKEP